MTRFFLVAVFLLAIPMPAIAGILTPKTKTCSVGGETYEVWASGACTRYGGIHKMSSAPETTCEDTYWLPQCPGNKLPMYREFTEEETILLELYMKTDEYRSAVRKSRYWAAYVIEQKLDGTHPVYNFTLLLEGLWFDAAASFGDPAYLDTFEDVARIAAKDLDEDELAFSQAVRAYAKMWNGNPHQARALLKMISTDVPILRRYVEAIDACLDNQGNPLCAPDSLLLNR